MRIANLSGRLVLVTGDPGQEIAYDIEKTSSGRFSSNGPVQSRTLGRDAQHMLAADPARHVWGLGRHYGGSVGAHRPASR